MQEIQSLQRCKKVIYFLQNSAIEMCSVILCDKCMRGKLLKKSFLIKKKDNYKFDFRLYSCDFLTAHLFENYIINMKMV